MAAFCGPSPRGRAWQCLLALAAVEAGWRVRPLGCGSLPARSATVARGEGRPSAARSPDLRPRPGTRPTPQPRSPADAAPVGRGRRGRWLRPGEKLGVAGSGRRPWPVGDPAIQQRPGSGADWAAPEHLLHPSRPLLWSPSRPDGVGHAWQPGSPNSPTRPQSAHSSSPASGVGLRVPCASPEERAWGGSLEAA